MLPRPLYIDPFAPVLFSSPALVVSVEQRNLVKRVLELATSDSRFAEKAYAAIYFILTSGNTVLPAITSLVPNTAAIGSESFTLHVHGTGFDPLSLIIWNGSVEPTTFVSDTELTTVVDMSTAEVAIPIPVRVQASNGVMSDPVTFTLTGAVTPPAIVTLNPNTVALGAPDFTLHIVGGGFIPTSEVLLNGNPATPVTFVSAAQLDLPVDMSLVLAPLSVQVTVRNGASVSNAQTFTVTP